MSNTSASTSATVTDLTPATPLQRLMWPERGICTEITLYARLHQTATVHLADSGDANHVRLDRGNSVHFSTAANLFNLGKWREHCDLTDLQVRLTGDGEVGVTVFQAFPDRSWERLLDTTLTLTGQGTALDVSHALEWEKGTVLHVEVTGHGPARLTDVIWETRQAPVREPRLGLSITTFKREEAVTKTIERFADYLTTSPIRDHLALIVVDNGQTLNLPTYNGVTIVPNENLGGSGGFTRGLLETERAGATHCLFMDDDAMIHMQALERTYAFLAYATDPATAVSGGLIEARHRWRMWENGSTFNERCRPIGNGVDLRDIHAVYGLEYGTGAGDADTFYGGWWYFAFPLAAAHVKPFPFFVRGDDVSFSLMNDFTTLTLPGVLSFQDADFADKESAQTLYLDLRSHLVHHLVVPALARGRFAAAGIAWDFFKRSLTQLHYDTLASLNLAVTDVIAGPDRFAEMADMATRRADIKNLADAEVWDDNPTNIPTPKRGLGARLLRGRLFRWAMAWTVYGLLIPGWGRLGNTVVLPAAARGHHHTTRGASTVVYKRDDGSVMVLLLSRRIAFARIIAFTATMLTFVLNYNQIRDRWREGYDRLATRDFWENRLGLTSGTAFPEPMLVPVDGQAAEGSAA